MAIVSILIIVSGVGLLIFGSVDGPYAAAAQSLGPPEAPGLIVMVVGFFILFKSGRRSKGPTQDPDEHRAFPRDVEDGLMDNVDDHGIDEGDDADDD